MRERKHLGEQIRPTTFAEEYWGEFYLTNDNSGRQLVQVVIHREDARELVNMLRCRLKTSHSVGFSDNRASVILKTAKKGKTESRW
jgi:hypothetical protein